ncbi:hypothetical protein QTJ16_003937 [Diplocarpon rosae]|uniref:Uncharacterized protein n=1 Tax=Diplocarpon rosae TaxID=946125 RepID=A0AAD9WCR7_9HELO|nr:hypothetical protein QTJ16_003937 [Diplocarpon rosae]
MDLPLCSSSSRPQPARSASPLPSNPLPQHQIPCSLELELDRARISGQGSRSSLSSINSITCASATSIPRVSAHSDFSEATFAHYATPRHPKKPRSERGLSDRSEPLAPLDRASVVTSALRTRHGSSSCALVLETRLDFEGLVTNSPLLLEDRRASMGHWHRTFGTSRRNLPEDEETPSRIPSEEDDMSREEYHMSRRDHPDEEFGLPRPTGYFDASEFGDSVDSRYNRYPINLKPSVNSPDMHPSMRAAAEKHQVSPVPCAQNTRHYPGTGSTVPETSSTVSQDLSESRYLPGLTPSAKVDVASTHNEYTEGLAGICLKQTSGINLSPSQAPFNASAGSNYSTGCTSSSKRSSPSDRTRIFSSQIASHNRDSSRIRQVHDPILHGRDGNLRQRARSLYKEASTSTDTRANVDEGSYFVSHTIAKTGPKNDVSCLESLYNDDSEIPVNHDAGYDANHDGYTNQDDREKIPPNDKESVDYRREQEERRKITDKRDERSEVAVSQRPKDPIGNGSGSGTSCEQSKEKRKKVIQPRSEMTTAAATPSRVNVNGQVVSPSIRSQTSAFDMMERVSRSAPTASVGIDHILDHASDLMQNLYASSRADVRYFSDEMLTDFRAKSQTSDNEATLSSEIPINFLISDSRFPNNVADPVEEAEGEVQTAEFSSRDAGADLSSADEVNTNTLKKNKVMATKQKTQSVLRQSISKFNLRERATMPQSTPRPRPVIGEPLRPEHTWGKGTVMEEALDLPPPSPSMGLILSSKDFFTVTPRAADYASVPTLRKSSTIAQMNSQPSTLRPALKPAASQGTGAAAAPRMRRSTNTVHFDLPAAPPQLTKSTSVAQMMSRVPLLSRAPAVRSRYLASKLNSITDVSENVSSLEQSTEVHDNMASDDLQASGVSSLRLSIPLAPGPPLSKSKSRLSMFGLSNNKGPKDLRKTISDPIAQTSEHLQGRGIQFAGVTGQPLPSNAGVDPRLMNPNFNTTENSPGPGYLASLQSANMITHVEGNRLVLGSGVSNVALNTTRNPGLANTTSSQRSQEQNKSTTDNGPLLGSDLADLENERGRSPGTMSNFTQCDDQGQRTRLSVISPRQYSSMNEPRTRHTPTPTQIPSPISELANVSRSFTNPGISSRPEENTSSTLEHSLMRRIAPARLQSSGIPMAKSRNLDSFSSFGRSMVNVAVRNQSTAFLRAEPTTAVSVEPAVAQAPDEKKLDMVYESPDGVYPWSGYLSGLENRYRTEFQDQLLSSPTAMERLQSRQEPSRPDMRRHMSDQSHVDIDNVVDTVGLANYANEEERMCKTTEVLTTLRVVQRAFIVLAGRCVGEATRRSLWEYQGLFAQVSRMPALKPRPRDVLQTGLMSRFSRVIGRSYEDV